MPWKAEQGRTFLLRAALVVPLLATGGAAPDPDRVSAEEAVRRAWSGFNASIESGSQDTVAAYLAPEWEMFIASPKTQRRVSREAWLASFAKNFKPGSVKFVINDQQVHATDEMAWTRIDEFHDWNRGPDQPPNRIHYLTTHVWERRGSRWVLVHTHHSHLP